MQFNFTFISHCTKYLLIANNEQCLVAFRQPITEVDNCNIADVLFISQIYNVVPKLKYNIEQMLR